MQKIHQPVWRAGAVFAALLLFGSVSQADTLDTTVQTEQQTNQQGTQSQQRIDALADQTDDLTSEYRRIIREADNLRVYNEQLQRVINNQLEEIQIINSELENLEETNRGIMPLIQEMVAMLEKLVGADLPFLQEQRMRAVNALKDDLDRADVTTSEKYRRVMEAYSREIDYGRNASHYAATLPGTDRKVDFLKVGRTLLLYQSLNGETTGWFNPATRQFEELPGEYDSSVLQAMRIAKNQEAPNLVKLPVPGATGVQQ